MVEETLMAKSLVIEFNMGMKNGKPDIKSRRFSNAKENATPQALHDTATALAGLVDHQGANFKTIDTNSLM